MSHKPKQRETAGISSRLDYCKDSGRLFWKNGPRKGKEAGWSDRFGYKLTRLDGLLLRNHHIIWFLETSNWPEFELDHIDNDPTNNRFDNLRPADRKKQGSNQKLQKRRQGQWKGVHKSGNTFYVKIKHNGKSVNGVGCGFKCDREAALVYNMWAERLFGPYANFNRVFEDVYQSVLDNEFDNDT